MLTASTALNRRAVANQVRYTMVQHDPLGGADALTIFTVGHSNHPLDRFLALLERHHIQSLVDVRSQPYSRYVTHFNQPELEDAVERRKVRYVYMGDELGGRPIGDEFYDAEGYVLYYRVAQAPFFLSGIERLIDEGAQYRAAIMCSEEDPTNCHRRLLIARVLQEQGVKVVHIRADGGEQDETDFRKEQEQLSLWETSAGEEREEGEWKSIRPVSRRRAPSSSSNPSDEWGSSDF